MVFQYVNGQWTVPTNKFCATTTSWKRESYTFKLDQNCKGWMFRIRFDAKESSQDKKIWFRNLKLEKGSFATPWLTLNASTYELNRQTNEIKQTVDSNIATISKVQKDQGTMQSTLNEVKQTTDSNSQTIKTLTQTQGEHGQLIQDNKSSIIQLNNQIESKVSETQMQDYVGKIGETNLIFNALFETKTINEWGNIISSEPSLKDWGTWTADVTKAEFRPNAQSRFGGYNSTIISALNFTSDSWTSMNQVFSNIDIWSDYTFSAMYLTTNKSSIDAGAYAEIKAWNGDTLVKSVGFDLLNILENGVWKEMRLTIPKLEKPVTHLQITTGIRQNGSFYISNPSFQKGSTKSVFLPNPRDIANYDAMVKELAKKVATSEFNSKVSTLETSINQQSDRINLKAEATDVYSKTEADGTFGSKAMVEKHESSITVMSDEINSTVKKGDIISSINQTAEQITIDVAKLNINADTVVKWLTAKGIDADVIKISGDKVTIDKNGITAKMADFLYEDDNGQKFSVIPRKNLIVDHCFAHITKGYQNAQFFNIQYSPFWEIHGSPAVENSIVETGMEGMINAMRINGEDWIRYKHFRDVQPGKKYTISAHFRAAMLSGKKVTAEPTIRVKFGTWQGDNPVDKQIFEKKFSAPKIADGKIVRYTVTFTVPQDYNMSNGYIFFDIFAYGQVAYEQSCMVSGIQLVEGELPCIYSWDLSYAQAVSGETPFSGFTLGTVDNAFLFENNRNKIPFITAAGDGHALEIKGVSHGFVSFTDQNGRFGYIGHGSPNDNRFRISTRNNVSFDKYIEAPGINMGGGAFHGPGSMYYGEGFQGINWYINEGGWRVASI
ncbi:hypothetical protein [Bacillus cereus]|uniref:hypothetical protein n=1 Tax=Bacillus cereus TaxID=1396 RepID=UPI003A92D3C5